MFKSLHSASELEAALEASHERPIVLFKHSASCPFSARAQEEVCNAKHDVDVYGIVVQYCPDLKDLITEKTGVEHASPQAIVVSKGNAIWKGWRSEITEEVLVKKVG